MRLKIALMCMKLQAFSKHSVIDAHIKKIPDWIASAIKRKYIFKFVHPRCVFHIYCKV